MDILQYLEKLKILPISEKLKRYWSLKTNPTLSIIGPKDSGKSMYFLALYHRLAFSNTSILQSGMSGKLTRFYRVNPSGTTTDLTGKDLLYKDSFLAWIKHQTPKWEQYRISVNYRAPEDLRSKNKLNIDFIDFAGESYKDVSISNDFDLFFNHSDGVIFTLPLSILNNKDPHQRMESEKLIEEAAGWADVYQKKRKKKKNIPLLVLFTKCDEFNNIFKDYNPSPRNLTHSQFYRYWEILRKNSEAADTWFRELEEYKHLHILTQYFDNITSRKEIRYFFVSSKGLGNSNDPGFKPEPIDVELPLLYFAASYQKIYL